VRVVSTSRPEGFTAAGCPVEDAALCVTTAAAAADALVEGDPARRSYHLAFVRPWEG
jgi:hypothetical protein